MYLHLKYGVIRKVPRMKMKGFIYIHDIFIFQNQIHVIHLFLLELIMTYSPNTCLTITKTQFFYFSFHTLTRWAETILKACTSFFQGLCVKHTFLLKIYIFLNIWGVNFVKRIFARIWPSICLCHNLLRFSNINNNKKILHTYVISWV